MLFGDAGDAGDEALVDPGAEAPRRAVRADVDLVPGLDPEPPRVVRRELHLGRGPLEGQLGDALDGGAREEWPVADEAQAASLRRRDRCGRAELASRLPAAQSGALAHLAVRKAAEDPLRELA